MLVLAEMVALLDLERGLQDRLGQPGQKAARADQFHLLGPGPLDDLTRRRRVLLTLLLRYPGLRHMVTGVAPDPYPPRAFRLGVSSKISYTVRMGDGPLATTSSGSGFRRGWAGPRARGR